MTEDPVKLYVVVMGILVAVLGFVAKTSYNQAAAYEHAITEAPRQAKMIREQSARVTSLINQLAHSKLKDLDHIQLVENAARTHLGGRPSITPERPQRIPPRGKELRWKVVVSRGSRGGTTPVTRDKIAHFCQQVERDSRGILKVIEVQIRREQGEKSVPVGAPQEIRGERYTTTIVVGMRVVE
ncbi:MAG: hypothetical protein ACYTGZ_04670 [Planctomycetota bacterium]